MKRSANNNGFALPAAVIVILVLSLMGMAFLDVGRLEAAQVLRGTHYLKALNLAEAGLARGLWVSLPKMYRSADTAPEALTGKPSFEVSHIYLAKHRLRF